MGKVIMSGIVPQLEEPSSVKPNFADNDWAAIIEACQKNKIPETWVVGDQKPMTINGTDYTIDIIGKNHDVYSDGSGTAPLTFQMHNCYATGYAMNNSDPNYGNRGGWSGCKMRASYLPDILSKMPSEVQAGIKEVNKLTAAGGGSSTIETTADKLFLLSDVEVRKTFNSYGGEGTQYAYYAAGNSAVKTIPGTDTTYWWLRSPDMYDTAKFCIFNSSSPADNAWGVAFAFCF